MRRRCLGTIGDSSSSRDTFVWRPESTDVLSREEDELRELLELFENVFLIFSFVSRTWFLQNVSTLVGRSTTTTVCHLACHNFIQGNFFGDF
jgi:hypothetical protein